MRYVFEQMGDQRYVRCRICGRSADEVGTLSWTRQCSDCGMQNLSENVWGMTQIGSPAWRRWRNAMAATFGGPLLDDLANPVQSDGHAS